MLARALSLAAALFLVATLMCPVDTFAGDGDGGQAGEFLRYGASVRSLALGRAFVAMADDAGALYYNPAALLHVPRKYSVYGLWFKPFHESRYNVLSAAFPRLNPQARGAARIFFGPEAAWGVSAVHLATDGFEYRNEDDRLLDDDFGIYQQAFMVGFAREMIGAKGVLGFGLNMKLIRHGVTHTDLSIENSDWGFGLDLGAQLQMLNPPGIKDLLSLKSLLPLRLGLSIQNVVPPKVGFGGEADTYPTVLRVGGCYTVHDLGLVDSLHIFDSSRICLVTDLEWMFADVGKLLNLSTAGQRGMGSYFGIEFDGQIDKVNVIPRIGYNTVSKTLTPGFGLRIVSEKAALRLDYAYGKHEELRGDHRISMTITLGRKRDAKHYWVSEAAPPSLSRKKNALHVLAGYPEGMAEIRPAAMLLATTLDTDNARRYWEFVRGPDWADILFGEAKDAFRRGDTAVARDKARQAATEYEAAHSDPVSKFGDEQYLNWSEAWMITAATESEAGGAEAKEAWTAAAAKAEKAVSPSLLKHYLSGVCFKNIGKPDSAITHFDAAIRRDESEVKSMRRLSYLWLGLVLLERGRYDSAIAVLTTRTQDYTPERHAERARLGDDYPHYPVYAERGIARNGRYLIADGNLADDAQYLIAHCYRAMGDKEQAAAGFVKICRFYPDSEKCRDPNVRQETENAIKGLLDAKH